MRVNTPVADWLNDRYFTSLSDLHRAKVDYLLTHLDANALREQIIWGIKYYASIMPRMRPTDAEDALEPRQLVAMRYGLNALLRCAAYMFAIEGSTPTITFGYGGHERRKQKATMRDYYIRTIGEALKNVGGPDVIGEKPVTCADVSDDAIACACVYLSRFITRATADPMFADAHKEAREHPEYKRFTGRPAFDMRMFMFPYVDKLEQWFDPEQDVAFPIAPQDKVNFSAEEILRLLGSRATFMRGNEWYRARMAREWVTLICGLINMSPEDYYKKCQEVYRTETETTPSPPPPAVEPFIGD